MFMFYIVYSIYVVLIFYLIFFTILAFLFIYFSLAAVTWKFLHCGTNKEILILIYWFLKMYAEIQIHCTYDCRSDSVPKHSWVCLLIFEKPRFIHFQFN